jgi:hypothetical protein|tara:strand:- start:34 stop:384 length:351 start_codon:yes stop_codon:yes gene_type:complete
MQEVKVMPLRERQFDVRSWAEAAEIVDALDKIIGGGNQGVSIAIGRSASYLGQCQTKDQIPNYTILALKYLLLEQEQPQVSQFTKEDLATLLFCVAKEYPHDTDLMVKVAGALKNV